MIVHVVSLIPRHHIRFIGQRVFITPDEDFTLDASEAKTFVGWKDAEDSCYVGEEVWTYNTETGETEPVSLKGKK
jgi:hypothetical protein